MRRNVYSSAVFARVDLFALKFYLDGRHPAIMLSIRKLETLGYQTVKITSLCVPSF